MPKARKAELATPAAETTPEHTPAISTAGEGATAAVQEPPAQKAAGQSAYAPDPTPVTSVNLSGTKDGQSMQLLRSHRFKQMQVKFEGAQPDEQYLKMLTDNGWKDRTESEGVFTKQIDQDARWQSVQKMEQEFRDVANAIRGAKGLGPVLEGLAA